MSTQRRIAVIAVALALVLALGWLALRDAPPAGGTAPGATAGAAAAAAAASDARTAIQRIVAQAQIVPIDGIIEVRPLAGGRVLRVLVHPGDRVGANQLLAEIESDLQSASVKQRTADLGAASERLKLAAEGVRPEEQADAASAPAVSSSATPRILCMGVYTYLTVQTL